MRHHNNILFPAFSSFYNDMVSNGTEKRSVRPSVNILKNEGSYSIQMALPGVAKEDVAISVDNDKLTIKSVEKENAEVKFKLKEFDYSNFSRTFTMSNEVDAENITAAFEHGVLSLTIPVKENAKQRTIEIS